MNKQISVVAFGGGSGSHAMALNYFAADSTIHLTTVVGVSDSGGESGRLYVEWEKPSASDAMKALCAHAHPDFQEVFEQVLMHRFPDSAHPSIARHRAGSRLIMELVKKEGIVAAIEAFSRLMRIRGQVLPITEVPYRVELKTFFLDHGESLQHEAQFDDHTRESPITNASIVPPAPVGPQVLLALHHADIVVFNPGSFGANLGLTRFDGFEEIMHEICSRGVLTAMIVNVMNRAETFEFEAAHHVEVMQNHIFHDFRFDLALCNWPVRIDKQTLLAYEQKKEYPTIYRSRTPARLDICDKFAVVENGVIRHSVETAKRILGMLGPHRAGLLKRSLIP